MNSLEIMHIVNSDPLSKQIFEGVYPCDRLPKYKVMRRPAAFIANTDDSRKRGRHWVLIVLCRDNRAIFFDSYGMAPDSYMFPKHFIKFLKKNSVTILYNNRQIQSDFSSFCGHYCLFVLFHLVRGRFYKSILKKFNSALEKNDLIVKYFIRKHVISVRNTPCKYQICTAQS